MIQLVMREAEVACRAEDVVDVDGGCVVGDIPCTSGVTAREPGPSAVREQSHTRSQGHNKSSPEAGGRDLHDGLMS